jgi:midasin
MCAILAQSDHVSNTLRTFFESIGEDPIVPTIDDGIIPAEDSAAGDILAALQSVAASRDTHRNSLDRMLDIAHAFSQFSAAFVSLYIPDKPFDPASEIIVRQKVLTRRRDEGLSRLESRTAIENRMRATASRTRIHDSERLDSANKALETASRTRVVRPTTSQISSIHEDFRYVVNLMAMGWLKDPYLTPTQVSNILANLERVANRLLVNYPMYKDLLLLPSYALSRLIFGVRMKLEVDSMVALNGPALPSLSALFSIDRLTQPLTGDIWNASRPKGERRIDMEYNLFSLEVILLSSKLRGLLGGQVQLVGEILDDCYREWRISKERQKLEQAAKTDIYKRNDTEYDLENAVAEFFPDQPLETSALDASSKGSEEEMALSVYHLHRNLFGSDISPISLSDIHRTIMSGYKFAVANPNTRDLNDIVSISYPAQILALASALREQPSPVDPAQYDFYRSANLDELETLVSVLSSTSKRVTTYLDAWPENAILGDIIAICEKMHGLPATLPLSRVLPYVERFYATLDQWQKVASRDYTLAEVHQKVKETIVRWRKLELGSWRTLMAEEEKKHRDQVSLWWFDIYELVLYNARNRSIDVPDYAASVVAAVNDFILSSSVGDFEVRLQLVLSFANHAQHEVPSRPKMEAVSRLCHHLYRLHSVHAASVRDTLVEQRKVLEKQVAETVQLASWRDTSVYALTESAKRSHYRLYKTIRKFRELLSKPVGPILQAAGVISLKSAATSTAPTLSRSADFSKSYENDLVTGSAKMCELRKVWSPHGRMFSDPIKLSSSVAQIFSRVSAQSHELPISVEEFIETIETLAKQTPSTLTKENERQVKFLKTQKRRLFAQTMKELREWGISSRLSTHSNTTYILQLQATPVAPQGSTSPHSSSVDLFYRILDVLPKLRQASIDHSQDLTDAESQRALGYVENLIDEVFASRSLLFDLSNSVHALKTKFESTLSMFVKHAAETESRFVSPMAPAPVNSRRILLRKIDVVIITSISVLHAHHELTTADDITPILSSLQAMQTSCRNHSTIGADMPFNDEIVYPAGVKWCNEVDKWFFESRESLMSLARQHRGFTYVFDPIVRSLEEIRSVDNVMSAGSKSEFDFDAFQSQAEGLGASCLVASQELSKTLDTIAIMGTTRLQGKNFFRSITKILQSPSLVERMAATHREAILAVKSPDQLATVLPVTTCLLPVLEEFISGCIKVLDRISEDHNQFCRMTLVLMTTFHTLATKGYCSPQPADKEPGGKTADGVGLGEGEGETDITDQLKGDQEGLDELDHGEKGERKDEKGEEDGEGIEMDDDFEGEMEDAEDQEREEEDEEGESGDEMDEGTGAVDDLDPSAVDEQFWEDQSRQPDTAQDEKQMEGKNQKEEKSGELGAGKQDEKSKDDLETSMEDQEELKEGEDADESGDEDVQNREDDARMPEAEPLDLPDDLDLNQPDGDKKDEDMLSDDGLELDDEMEVDGGQGEEAENLEESDGEDEDGFAEDAKMGGDDEEEVEAPEEGVDSHQPDRTEYQGDDVVPSDAAGKGGENAAEDPTASGQESAETAENATVEEPPASIAQVGASRSADPTKEVQTAPRNADEHQSSERSESTPNPFRQLADQLEQWRRDLRNVQDVASEDATQEQTVGDTNPDFSYVGEDEKWNDQALGPAAQDQIQPLDMSMAIDENEAPPEPHLANDDARAEPQTDQMDTDGRPQAFSSGAFIGQSVVTIPAPDDVDMSDLNPDGTSDELLEPRDPADARIESTEIPEEARQTWRKHDRETHDLSLSLCEQLRLILEPTQATKMRGDFRTGKRLNMRRIIPYIASDYKKDKIWMRRTKPSKRQYQVMIAMDDSKSMSDSKSVKLAFDTLALTAKALSQLEVGQISIVRFGEDVKVVHAFEEPFNTESGGKVVHHFKFDQSRTDVAALTKASINLFNVARAQQDVRSVSGSELWQLQLIISDGICEDHEGIRRLVREALDSRIMMIFVILDAIHPERKDSILDIKSYSFEAGEKGQVLRESRYLDSFPFSYFVIVRDIRELPLVLASALRQWFAEVAER